MLNEQQISEKITIGGAPKDDEIAHIYERGFATVINLCTPDEPCYREERDIEQQGLSYASIPTEPALLDDIKVAQFIQEVDSSDGPVYLHCKGGGRAGILALLHEAIAHGWNIATALEKGREWNIKIGDDSPYRAFFESYLRRHSAGERDTEDVDEEAARNFNPERDGG